MSTKQHKPPPDLEPGDCFADYEGVWLKVVRVSDVRSAKFRSIAKYSSVDSKYLPELAKPENIPPEEYILNQVAVETRVVRDGRSRFDRGDRKIKKFYSPFKPIWVYADSHIPE